MPNTRSSVGQFPDASKEEALALYARRYLDLKAKLDLFANRLKSANVKNREIDDTLKTLAEETAEPAVVGDIAAHQGAVRGAEGRGRRQEDRHRRGPQGRDGQGRGRAHRDCGEGRGASRLAGRQHELAFDRGQVP